MVNHYNQQSVELIAIKHIKIENFQRYFTKKQQKQKCS